MIVRHPIVEIRSAVANRGSQNRRVAARIQQVAAGVVERKAQAEIQTFAHLGHAAPQSLGRQQVESADLIVGPEVAPVRTVGTVLPARARWAMGLTDIRTGTHGRSSMTGCAASVWRARKTGVQHSLCLMGVGSAAAA